MSSFQRHAWKHLIQDIQAALAAPSALGATGEDEAEAELQAEPELEPFEPCSFFENASSFALETLAIGSTCLFFC